MYTIYVFLQTNKASASRLVLEVPHLEGETTQARLSVALTTFFPCTA